MRKIIKFGVVSVLIILISVVVFNYPRLNIITGFAAKSVCSCTFEAGRDLKSIEEGDNDINPVYYAKNVINFDEKSVSSTVFGLKKRTAIYKEGIGCVLVPENLTETASFKLKRTFSKTNLPYPYGELPQKDTIFSNINYKLLTFEVENAFDCEGEQLKRTRAVLVVYKNKIIAEKYAEGIDKDTRLLGWSMTKSLMSAVCGVMSQQGLLNVDEAAPIKAWKNDDRSKITVNNLLQMNSGLQWEEDYTKISDVTKMLYLETDMAKSQAAKPLAGQPNDSWNYSSGTSNLVSGIMRKKFNSHQEYLDFWYSELIDKIGMHSMLVETDLAGNYIASTYGWANTRDWARFGLLYLNKGNWNGEQLFSENWVNYTTTPTNTSEGVYGAQFWLNAGGHLPDVPKDMFFADGYQGQRVFVIPSKELVVVRLGVTYSKLNELLETRAVLPNENKNIVDFELTNKDSNKLLKEILNTID